MRLQSEENPSNFSVCGLVGCQLSLSSSQTSTVGGWASASSSEAVVMSMVAGWRSVSYVSPVPQWLQNCRVTPGDEWKTAGIPDRIVNCERRTVIQATTGAPLARRQLRQ